MMCTHLCLAQYIFEIRQCRCVYQQFLLILIRFLCTKTSQFVYPFLGWWIFNLFQGFTIMNKDAMNILVQIFCVHIFSFLLGILSEVELLGYEVSIFFIINCQLVYQSDLLSYTPNIAMYASSRCSTSSPTLGILSFL